MEQSEASAFVSGIQDIRTERGRATLIYGRDLSWYLRIVKTIVTAVSCYGALVALAAAVQVKGAQYLESSLFIVKTACFVWIGAKVSGRYREPVRVAAVTGGIAGMGMGIVIAFAKFAIIQEAWTFFNCITEPVVTGIIGYAAAGLGGVAFGPSRRRDLDR